jgi:serine/threonine protein phosphatase 1
MTIPQFCPAPATLPPGHRIYAIGDIHGCLDKLLALHDLIVQDMADRITQQTTLVHMGDYIDRGPDSAGVIQRLVTGALPSAGTVINLMGNHEQMMIDALDGGDVLLWLDSHAASSLESWGANPAAPVWEWLEHIPTPHLTFIRGLALAHRAGPYFFVHAGIRAGVPLDRQDVHDMLWIREGFLDSDADFGAIIVHGHTPKNEVIVRPNRIGIDTGAVRGGVLTCLVLEEDRMGLIQI